MDVLHCNMTSRNIHKLLQIYPLPGSTSR